MSRSRPLSQLPEEARAMVAGREASDRISPATELQIHWIRELAGRLELKDRELRLLISGRLRRSAGPDLKSFMDTSLTFGEAAKLYRLLLKISHRRSVVDRQRQGLK